MGIRHKLLILLLLISLIPLLAIGVGIKKDLARLGEELAARSAAVLIRKAHSGLQRIVENDANDTHGAEADDISIEAEGVTEAYPDAAMPDTGTSDSTEGDDGDDGSDNIDDSDTPSSNPDA